MKLTLTFRRAAGAFLGGVFPLLDGATTQRGFELGAVEANGFALMMQNTIGLWPYCFLLCVIFSAVGMAALLAFPWPSSRLLRVLLAVGCWVSLFSYLALVRSNLEVIASLS